MRDTLLACLERAARVGQPVDGLRFLDRHENATWHTWVDIHAGVARMAGGLHAAGVRRGDRVAVILPTGVEFIELLFASAWLGAVPVPLYPPVRLGRLDEYYDRTARMLARADTALLVTDTRINRILGPLLPRFAPRLGVHIAAGLGTASPVPTDAPGPDDLALIQFSSGTTQDPKPVGLTHRQILCNAEAILDFMPADADYTHVGVSWLPLYHDMGLIGCILPAVHRPGPLTLLPPEAFLARPALWLRAISKYRGTVSPAPNFAFGLCNERIQDEDLQGCDLSSWRLALNGAEPTSPPTMRAFIERFSKWGLRAEAVTPVYGLSEAALAVTFGDVNAPFRSQRFDPVALSERQVVASESGTELASVGRPLRGFDVDIRTPVGAASPPQEIGEVWVRGGSIMAGYVDGTEAPIRGDWLQTGDLGFVFENELYITGRAKDVLVIRGRNHAPHVVEAAVDAVAGVRTGCTAAVADLGEHGEHLLVFVEYRGEPDDDLPQRCRQAILGSTGLDPDLVVVLGPGTLPRTSSGKIRRAETLRQWHANALTPPKSVTPWYLAGALARSTWARIRHGVVAPPAR
jgi:fatty-acyl-CoA synthase